MKIQSFSLIFAVAFVCHAAPVKFTVQHSAACREWSSEEDGTLKLVSAGKRYPYITLLPEVNKNTLYKLSFDAEGRNVRLAIEYKDETFVQSTRYPAEEKHEYEDYFLTGTHSFAIRFRGYANDPAQPVSLQIRNIRIEEAESLPLQTNFLKNGDFEQNTPDNFQLPGHHQEMYAKIVPNEGFMAGRRNLKLSAASWQKKRISTLEFPYRPGEEFSAEFWAKSSQKARICFSLDFVSPRSHSGKHFYVAERFNLGEEWQRFQIRAIVPNDLKTYPDLNDHLARGRFWLDNGTSKDAEIWIDGVKIIRVK